jgi:nitrous oxidase accessory protein NosD
LHIAPLRAAAEKSSELSRLLVLSHFCCISALAEVKGVPMANVIRIAAGASASQVQSAIDKAPAHSTIQLAAGTYNFTRTVVIDRDNITLTGAGEGRTVITADASLNGQPAIRVGSALFKEDKSDPITMSYAKEGSRQIKVESDHGLRKGDTIWIEQTNDSAFLDKIGDELWREDKPLRTAQAVVTSVNGNSVTLDRDLPFTFQSKGTTVEKMDVTRNVTVENLTLRGDHGTSDPSKFHNTLSGQDSGMMMLVNATDNATVRNVSILEPDSNGIVIAKSLDAEVNGLTVRGAHEKGDDGNGYGVWIRDVYDSEFRNLEVHDTRHAVLFASQTSAVGNYVHVRDTNRDINFHGGLDHDNVVVVDNSVRTSEEATYLGAVTYVNEGTDFGAPTDPDANRIVFGNVTGTVRADVVHAASGGASISTRGGADTIHGGNGSDNLRAGTGDDFIFASGGSDTIRGDDGKDTVQFDEWRSEVVFSVEKGALVARTDSGTTFLYGVEGVRLENGWYSAAELSRQATLFSDDVL